MNFNKTLLYVHNKIIKKYSDKGVKCGISHEYRNCPAFNKVCHNCGNKNHFSKWCRRPNKQISSSQAQNRFKGNKQSAHNVAIFSIESELKDAASCTVQIFGSDLNFQLDTGAALSILSRKQRI